MSTARGRAADKSTTPTQRRRQAHRCRNHGASSAHQVIFGAVRYYLEHNRVLIKIRPPAVGDNRIGMLIATGEPVLATINRLPSPSKRERNGLRPSFRRDALSINQRRGPLTFLSSALRPRGNIVIRYDKVSLPLLFRSRRQSETSPLKPGE